MIRKWIRRTIRTPLSCRPSKLKTVRPIRARPSKTHLCSARSRLPKFPTLASRHCQDARVKSRFRELVTMRMKMRKMALQWSLYEVTLLVSKTNKIKKIVNFKRSVVSKTSKVVIFNSLKQSSAQSNTLLSNKESNCRSQASFSGKIELQTLSSQFSVQKSSFQKQYSELMRMMMIQKKKSWSPGQVSFQSISLHQKHSSQPETTTSPLLITKTYRSKLQTCYCRRPLV